MRGRSGAPAPPAPDAPIAIAERLELVYDLRMARRVTKLGRALGGAAWGGGRQASRFRALEEVSFEVRPGERLGVIGPNGAGKTSLLSVLAGVIEPTGGRLLVRGRVSALLGLGTSLDQELTGRENAELAGRLEGLAGPALADWAGEAIDFAELGEMADAPVKVYSSGMRARLGFALATAVRPMLLLLDEVIGTGDLRFRRRADARMDELWGRAGAVVLVSHDLATVERRCDRVIVLEAGRIVADDVAARAIAAYRERQAARA